MIRDAFQHWRHLGYRQHKPQIARRRLSQRKDIYALAINGDFQLIDFVVMFEHFTRRLSISLRKGTHRFDQRGFRFAAQTQNAGAQYVEFFVKMSVNFHDF
jgi:hypothetical protein